MDNENISRRDFIDYMGAGAAAISLNTLLNACAPLKTDQPILAGITPDLEFIIRAAPGKAQILDGSETDVWHYEGEVIKGPKEAMQNIPGSYLGPIIHARKGQTVRVTFTNKIPEPSIIHWHGLHVPESADGHPQLVIDSGETYVYDFTVNDRAGMYWYHPHPHGRTGPQVYQGLAGLFIVSDDEEDILNLPSGEYDIPLVIQDRNFDDDNQFEYNLQAAQITGVFGDRILINGKPDFEIRAAARPYRLRLLNGSNARIYALAWSDGSPLTIIGTDGGLLEKPIERDYIVLSPAERIDMWVDLSKYETSDQLYLLYIDPTRAGAEEERVLTIRVDHEDETIIELPKKLSVLNLRDVNDAVNIDDPRKFILSMGMGRQWLINGKTFEMMDVDKNEQVKLGDLEVWEVINQANHGMGTMQHPMHIHGLQFQIIERESTPENQAVNSLINRGQVDEGWHDTVLVMPGERVRILLKFEDFEGLYLYHCHNLEHEDMGMMRNFRISA